MTAIICAGLALLLAAGALGFRLYRRHSYPLRYTAEVERWAGEYGLDPYLVYSVIRTESSFDPSAQSSAGAIGLMQMTSDTFDWIKSRIAEDEPLVFEDLYQPGNAIRFGCCYLAISLERYGGDVPTAAAAYHSGWGTVDGLLAESGGEVLSEFPYRQMSHYVDKINRSYETYLRLYAG